MEGYTNAGKSKILEYGRVKYVEPNDITNDGFTDDGVNNIVFNPEQYGMFVDLVVECYDRFNPEKESYAISWDGVKTNVMSGKEFKVASGMRRFLSTDVLNTSYNDIQNGYNSEDFGISSIDITYNSWYIPEVNINFTDVRGVSLLTPADYYDWHSSDNNNGNPGTGLDRDYEYYIRSFVSSFFKFPYPRYFLRIKGFYGDPVTYTLCVTDFRTSFNSKTGNFDINVKFVGYLFGVLTDIPMRFLYTAPFDRYFGRAYWKSQIEGNRFVYDNGTQMLKYPDFMCRVERLSGEVEEDTGVSNANANLTDLMEERGYLESIRDAYVNYMKNYRSTNGDTFVFGIKTSDDIGNNEDGTTVEEDIWDVLVFPQFAESTANVDYSAASQDEKVDGVISLLSNPFDDEDLRDNFNKAVETYANKYNGKIPGECKRFETALDYGEICRIDADGNVYVATFPGVDGDVVIDLKDKGRYRIFNNSNWKQFKNSSEYRTLFGATYVGTATTNGRLIDGLNNIVSTINDSIVGRWKLMSNGKETLISQTNAPIFSAVLVHRSKILGFVEAKLKAIDDQIKVAEENVSAAKESVIEKVLGFRPTIKNIMDMMLAHLETFTASIYQCIESVAKSNRTLAQYGISVEDTDIQSKSDKETKLPPFFGYFKNTRIDGYTKKQETWIGDEPRLHGLEEVKLVNGFLKGVLEVEAETEEYRQELVQRSAEISTKVTEDLIPSLVSDYILFAEGRPYYHVFDNNENGTKLQKIKDYFGMRLMLAALEYNSIGKDSNRNSLIEWFAEKEAYSFISSPGYKVINDEFVSTLSAVTEDSYYKYVTSTTNDGITYKDGVLNQPMFSDGKVSYGQNVSGSRYMWLIPYRYSNSTEGKKTGIDIYNTNNAFYSLVGENVYHPYGNIDIIEDGTTFENDCSLISGDIETEKIKLNDIGYWPTNLDQWREFYRTVTGTTRGYKGYKNAPITKRGDGYKNVEKFVNTGTKYNDYESFVTDGKNKKGKLPSYKFNDAGLSQEMLDDFSYSQLLDFRVSDNESLFASRFYYQQKEDGFTDDVIKKRKAFLFLSSLGINLNQVLQTLFKDKEYSPKAISLPMGAVLLLGGFLWAKKYGIKDDSNFISTKFKESEEILSKVIDLRRENNSTVFDSFVDTFEKWVDKDYQSIADSLEMKSTVGYAWKLDDYSDLSNYTPDRVPAAYIKVGGCTNGGIYLMNNPVISTDNSVYGKVNTILFSKWVVRIPYPVKFAVDNTTLSNVKLSEYEIKTAWKRFTSLIIKSFIDDEENEETTASEINDLDDVKITTEFKLDTYRTFKNLSDKWLTCTSKKKFEFTQGEYNWNKNESQPIGSAFIYINSYYERIGNTLIVSVTDLAKYLADKIGAQNSSYSLYNFMTDTASKNGMILTALPIFNDWDKTDSYKTIFVPKSFAETIAKAPVETENTYVFLYPEQASKNANIASNKSDDKRRYGYSNDSFMFAEDSNGMRVQGKDVPNSFSLVGDTIMAFGVTFAKGNQSFFKDIKVSMDAPKVTEQVIAQTLEISNQYATEGNTQVTAQGQNLFKVYSNNSYQCTVSMLGCPMIMPLMYFQLNNIPMFKGSYVIYNVKHNITPGNMTTTFVGQRLAKTRTPLAKSALLASPTNTVLGSRSGGSTYTGGGSYVPSYGTSKKNIYNIVSEISGVQDLNKLKAIHSILTSSSIGFQDGVVYQRFDPFFLYQEAGSVKPSEISGYCADNRVYDPGFVGCGSSSACVKIVEKVNNYYKNSSSNTKVSGELCVFYGAWYIPAEYWEDCGCLSLEQFIQEEGEGVEKQSQHFGKLLVSRPEVKAAIESSDWASEFMNKYLGNNHYLYGYATAAGVTPFETAISEGLNSKYEQFKEETMENAFGDIIRIDNIFDDTNNKPDDTPFFDVNKGITWLINNMQSKYYDTDGEECHSTYDGKYKNRCRSGLCLGFVNSALAAGGLPMFYASDACHALPSWQNSDNWVEITNDVVIDTNPNVRPVGCESGDIAIFDCDKGSHERGHIQICLGTREKDNAEVWASDFYQGNSKYWHGCGGTMGTLHVFRYKYRKSFSHQV